jgi:hypothetical protein
MRTPHSTFCRRGGEQWRWVSDVALTSSSVSRGIQQSKGNVGAADLYLADEEIAEIEGREINEPELVTAA